MKKKKYYGRDPFKKIMNDPEKSEKVYKILFLLNIWVWFSMFIGAVIFVIWAYKFLSV